MTRKVLSSAQLKTGLSLATREGALRYDWGDWALDVAGPPGDVGKSDASAEKLRVALDELAANGEGSIYPSYQNLREYREGAHAVPARLRKIVRSPSTARVLWQQVKDEAEREALIRKLAKTSPKGIVTERKVRDHFGRSSKDGPRVPKLGELKDALRDPETRDAVLADLDDDDVEEVREAVVGEDISRAVKAHDTRRKRTPSTGSTVSELGADDMAEELLATWADQPIDSLYAAAIKLDARIRTHSLVLGSYTPEEARERLIEIGKIVARALDGVDAFEAHAAGTH